MANLFKKKCFMNEPPKNVIFPGLAKKKWPIFYIAELQQTGWTKYLRVFSVPKKFVGISNNEEIIPTLMYFSA